MDLKSRILCLLATSLPLLILDQWSKFWASAHLKHAPPIYYLRGLFQLRYAENTGAWGSLGASWPELARKLFLIVLPVIILIIFLGHILLSKDVNRPLKGIGYSFIFAGGVGNLADRIRFGAVVDFMYMGTSALHTNIFNVADVAIMVGLGLILLISFREWAIERKKKQKNY